MLQINLIRERKIAKVAAAKGAGGPGFKFAIPKVPFHLGLVGSALAFLIVIAFIIGLYLSNTTQIKLLQNKIDSYQAELTKLSGPKRMVDEYVQKKADLNTKLSEIASVDQGRYREVRLLDGLSQSLIDNVWLTSFSEDGTSIKIDCLTFSNLIVADLMENMKSTGYFTTVELSQTQKTSIEGREVVQFSLTCGINPNPPDNNATNQAATAGRAQR